MNFMEIFDIQSNVRVCDIIYLFLIGGDDKIYFNLSTSNKKGYCDDYDESELNLIDDCLAKKHGELFTFGGKSYILTHEGRFMCISEVKRIEFDSMEVL